LGICFFVPAAITGKGVPLAEVYTYKGRALNFLHLKETVENAEVSAIGVEEGRQIAPGGARSLRFGRDDRARAAVIWMTAGTGVLSIDHARFFWRRPFRQL
jgi:hypothetical protein